MNKGLWLVFLVALIVVPMALVGCKGKVEKPQEMPPAVTENPGGTTTAAQEANVAVTEPAQTVATETIPPTAAPEIAAKPVKVAQEAGSKAKDIQTALKNAGFYAGAIDGKVGPRTKRSIEDFQKAKGLKVDGKVGPKTWTELEKYLNQ